MSAYDGASATASDDDGDGGGCDGDDGVDESNFFQWSALHNGQRRGALKCRAINQNAVVVVFLLLCLRAGCKRSEQMIVPLMSFIMRSADLLSFFKFLYFFYSTIEEWLLYYKSLVYILPPIC